MLRLVAWLTKNIWYRLKLIRTRHWRDRVYIWRKLSGSSWEQQQEGHINTMSHTLLHSQEYGSHRKWGRRRRRRRSWWRSLFG